MSNIKGMFPINYHYDKEIITIEIIITFIYILYQQRNDK